MHPTSCTYFTRISLNEFYRNDVEVGSPFSLDDIAMDSEQPIESPSASIEIPESPLSGFEMRAFNGTFPQPTEYPMKNKADLPKVNNFS